MGPPLFRCDSFKFKAICRQPEDFAAGLDARERAKLDAACQSVGQSFADGRPPAGRTELIRGSKIRGLFELRITWPGAPGPQLRLLCVREGGCVLVARGLAKRGRHIPRREIELAEHALTAYRSSAHDSQRGA